MYIMVWIIDYIYNMCCFGSKGKRYDELRPIMTIDEIKYEIERMPSDQRRQVLWMYVRVRSEEIRHDRDHSALVRDRARSQCLDCC